MAKFLVLWKLELGRVGPEAMRAVLRQQEHGRKLESQSKLLGRYHLVGRHGGAWIYDVNSHEELDHLLASAPVFNFATYEVMPLAEMTDRSVLLGEGEGG
ncbi:MAG: muconolactone Delta-isomerase family protein [Candidatus Dormibacteria bacterium]